MHCGDYLACGGVAGRVLVWLEAGQDSLAEDPDLETEMVNEARSREFRANACKVLL